MEQVVTVGELNFEMNIKIPAAFSHLVRLHDTLKKTKRLALPLKLPCHNRR